MSDSIPASGPRPNRRRFRFTLRTLFVIVTALAALSAWYSAQRTWIAEREAARKWVEGHRGFIVYSGGAGVIRNSNGTLVHLEPTGLVSDDGLPIDTPSAPFGLRLLGERAAWFIVLGNDGKLPLVDMREIDAKLPDLRGLFPESEIVLNP
jgi:hypothetical protein